MSTQNFNNPDIPVPSLCKLFDNKKLEIKTEINCMAIGTIQSFSTTDQTATVSINYLRTIYGGAATQDNDSAVNNQSIPYPQLVKCPVMMLTGGSSYLTFPIAKGDECVIFFNDRDIDTWWNTGSSSSAPNSARVHDLSDGIVFIGIRSVNKAISSYNMNGPQLTNGSNFISVEDKIKLSVSGATLRAALDSLCTALLSWVDTSGDTPNPATLVLINTAKSLIDGVLK